jgi:hypothetical protein
MSPVVGNQARRMIVCRAMTSTQRLLATFLLLVTVAACGSAAGPSSSPLPSPSPSEPAVDLPTIDPGAGGGSSGNTGSGIVDPGLPAGPNDPTGGGQAKLVVPKPGQANPHPIAPVKLEASVDGRHVLVKVTWYGGIEPCSVLDSVLIDRSGSTIALTVREGVGDPTAICIEIAELKATIVDLGELEPGTWQVTAPDGAAPALELTIA